MKLLVNKSKKLKTDKVIIVEGKYDKIALSSVIDARIVVLDGFRIFKDKEKAKMLRKIAEKSQIIVLTDSDGGGLVIRNYIRSIIPQDRIINLYIPEMIGKEKRKEHFSKEGFLGVEGMEKQVLVDILKPFAAEEIFSDDTGYEKTVTRIDLYEDGLLGGVGSSENRKELCKIMSLPQNISASSLLEAINLLYGYDEYKKTVNTLRVNNGK